MDALLRAVGQGSNRVITVCGLPGSGKTRLAAEAARRLPEEPGRVEADAVSTIVVRLAGVEDDSSLLAAFADARPRQHATGFGPDGSSTVDRQLVILDGAEYLSSNPDWLDRLTLVMVGCPLS